MAYDAAMRARLTPCRPLDSSRNARSSWTEETGSISWATSPTSGAIGSRAYRPHNSIANPVRRTRPRCETAAPPPPLCRASRRHSQGERTRLNQHVGDRAAADAGRIALRGEHLEIGVIRQAEKPRGGANKRAPASGGIIVKSQVDGILWRGAKSSSGRAALSPAGSIASLVPNSTRVEAGASIRSSRAGQSEASSRSPHTRSRVQTQSLLVHGHHLYPEHGRKRRHHPFAAWHRKGTWRASVCQYFSELRQ